MKFFSTNQTSRFLKSLDKRFASASVLMVTEDGRLLTLKANYKQYWSLPGGIIDAGEMPLEAACREVKEETGLTVDPASLKFRLTASRESTRLGMSYLFLFETTFESAWLDQIHIQASEIDEYAFVTKEEVLNNTRAYGAAVKSWANDEYGYAEYSAR